MNRPPAPSIHLCIIQPPGYVHSMGLLDAALYFRHQFRQIGANATIAKNRLRLDAPNLVFGAHLGFDPALARTYCCVFVNLEQLGPGGSQQSAAYLGLLRGSRVIDYDAGNPEHYGQRLDDVPLISFGYAPYLAPAQAAAALDQRPFDLLFFGSLNERRRRIIERIESTGRTVVTFDAPVYGPERDAFILQSRAVLNCHHYESARFEQVRAFQVLSLGTPLVSERTERTRPGRAFEASVNWFTPDSLETFFRSEYPAPEFARRAAVQLQAFRSQQPLMEYAQALDFAGAAFGATRSIGQARPNPQRLLHIGSGKDYRPGWLNVDILDSAQPDVRLDLGRAQALPMTLASPFWGSFELRAGASDLIYANNVLEHVPDLPAMMGNCLALLRVGGLMVIEVPHEASPGAWQDPTHVRAMNENSWLYYTDWFWYLGWFEHRFKMNQMQWLDANHAPCAKAGAAFMTVTLEKVPTTVAERMTARTMRPDFGGLLDPVTLPAAPAPAAATVPVRAADTPAPALAPAAAAVPHAPPPAASAGPRTAPPGAARPAQVLAQILGGEAEPPEADVAMRARGPAAPVKATDASAAAEDASTPASSEQLLAKVVAKLPAVGSVLEIGCGDGSLGARYKALHPQASWTGVDADIEVLTRAAGRLDAVIHHDADADVPLPVREQYDLIVFGAIFAQVRDPLRFLARIDRLCHGQSLIVCAVPNMSHHILIEQLLIGDLHHDAAHVPSDHGFRLFSPRSLVKLFLDGGWLPQLVDCTAYAADSPALPFLMQAAQALGCPTKTAVRNLALDQLVFECRPAPRAAPAPDAPARFSVVVPVTNRMQLDLNVLCSPGLRETGCEVIRVENAQSAGAAFRDGAARARQPWVLYCHQDVYLPRGSGAMLNRLIEELEAGGSPDPVVGFAGIGIESGGTLRYAGLCIDRLDRFDHPASDSAVSLDEFAVLLRRDTRHRIDPALGWHLWATDLCLQAYFADRRSARIVRIPVYHNSFNDHIHGEAFHASVRTLKAKYPQYKKIATIAAGVV